MDHTIKQEMCENVAVRLLNQVMSMASHNSIGLNIKIASRYAPGATPQLK